MHFTGRDLYRDIRLLWRPLATAVPNIFAYVTIRLRKSGRLASSCVTAEHKHGVNKRFPPYVADKGRFRKVTPIDM